MRHLPLALTALLALTTSLFALGTEDIGPTPVNAANYPDFPAFRPLLNNPHRVYHIWVNGNESFYFRGDLLALNAALAQFAAAAIAPHELILRPGPGIASTFSGDKPVPFNWSVHWTGGLSKDITTRDRGNLVWNAAPTFSLYLTDPALLPQLAIPKTLTLITLQTLEDRYKHALASTDNTVRGWTCGQLARLDPANPTNADAIAALLHDPDPWVISNAALSLAPFGTHASQTLPALKSALAANPSLKPDIETTIMAIANATPDAPTATQHQELLKAIENYASHNRNAAPSPTLPSK